MQELELHDQRHLEAAEGWLGLGDVVEASEELERITPQMRAHPFVLEVRWQIYAKAKKWDYAVEVARGLTNMLPDHPNCWIHLAFSLHELNRTREAKEVLLPIVDKFPEEFLIRYNLACYECQLGNQNEAFQWLQLAIDMAGKADVRSMALNDLDLEPMWAGIEAI